MHKQTISKDVQPVRNEQGTIINRVSSERVYGGDRFFILREDRDAFLAFCEKEGHKTRHNKDPFRDAYDIRHGNHWMAIIWNNATKRYSADRRLNLIVQSFVLSKQQESNG